MELGTTREEAATADAGGAVVDLEPDGGLDAPSGAPVFTASSA